MEGGLGWMEKQGWMEDGGVDGGLHGGGTGWRGSVDER